MALPTAAWVRERYLPYLSGTAHDTIIGDHIADADAALAHYCGFPLATAGTARTLESATYTFYLDGPDADASHVLSLPIRPLASVTSIHDDRDRDWSYGASDLVSSSDYTVDLIRGQIYLHDGSTHGSWSCGRAGSRILKVVCVAGFDTGDHKTIRRAIGMLVAHWMTLVPRQGNQASSGRGRSKTHRTEDIPSHITQILADVRLAEADFG